MADDPALLERVRTAGMPLAYLYWRPRLRFGFQRDNHWYGPVDDQLADQVRDFVARAQRHHGAGLREGGAPIADTTAQLAGFDTVALSADDWRLLVVPGLGGRALSLRDERHPLEWCHAGQPHDPDYPITGGYEEYTGPQWRRPGWQGDFAVSQLNPGLSFTRRLENAWQLTRDFTPLTAPLRGLQVRTTLRNLAPQRQELQLRGHPEWQVDDWATAKVRVQQADGTWRDYHPWRDGQQAGDLWLAEAACPASAWELWRGAHGLRLSYAQPLAKALLGWDCRAGVVRLESFAQAIWVAPGEAWTGDQHWTLLG